MIPVSEAISTSEVSIILNHILPGKEKRKHLAVTTIYRLLLLVVVLILLILLLLLKCTLCAPSSELSTPHRGNWKGS